MSRALARVARADISMRDLEESAVLGEAAAWALTERMGGDKGVRQDDKYRSDT
jgi:hypothetical protein